MRYFITSTGTGVGKTFVTASLAWQGRMAGRPVAAFKPVISGYGDEDSDTSALLQAQGLPSDNATLERISPYRFAAPLSPHLAAAREGRRLDFNALLNTSRAMEQPGGITLIEGVGGIMVPLNETHTTLDWMRSLGWPVVLVVGSYLGTLSHTLSAVATLQHAGVPIHAIIVSASAEAPEALHDTAESLRLFVKDVPIHTLARCASWQDAPSMLEWLA